MVDMDVGNATSSAGAADGKLEKEAEEKADNVDANIETDKMEVDKNIYVYRYLFFILSL